MKRSYMMKRNVDFRRMYRRGKSAVTPTLVVYAMKNRKHSPKIGISAGKKVGGAVERNRAKRRIRALFDEYIRSRETPPSFDFVIVARGALLDAEWTRLKKDFDYAMDKAVRAAGGGAKDAENKKPKNKRLEKM